MDKKACSRCKVMKPIHMFPSTKEGRVSCRCKECRNTPTKPKSPPYGSGEICPSCGEERYKSSFFAAKGFGEKSRFRLKICSICRSRAKIRVEAKIAYSCNANSGRSGNKLKADDIKNVMDMTGWRCWYCGDNCKGVDHVIPISKFGPNTTANLRPCCIDCNRVKKDKLFSIDELKSFREKRKLSRRH